MPASVMTTSNTAAPVVQAILDMQGVATGLVATPGGTQAAALALTAAMNVVSTVGTAADSVKLPLAVVGLVVEVYNTTATSMQVFGSGTDTITRVATATGVAQAAGKAARYICNVAAPAGNWERILSA